MRDLRNIWQHLQGHEVTPPDEVYFRLLQLLENEKKNNDIKIREVLKGLNEYEIQSPISAETIIKNIAINSSQIKTGGFANIIKRHRYRLIAASLLLASAIWGVSKLTSFSKNKPLVVKAIDVPIPKINDTTNLTRTNLASDSVRVHHTTKSLLKNSGIHARPFEQMRIGGQWISLTDNDILVTFTRFEYNNVPEIIAKGNDKDISIHLDKYSNIVITKTMSGMLKEMYQVKANGNPTRRARKSRERLENWKKTDESFFDGSKGKNPLDPIDMAEFIFK